MWFGVFGLVRFGLVCVVVRLRVLCVLRVCVLCVVFLGVVWLFVFS